MPSLAEYEDWKTGLQRSSVGRTNIVLSGAATVNPDQFAGDVALGKAFQLPPIVVTADRDGFVQKLRAKKNETILKSSPLLSSWLGIEDNAKLAHDDLDNLSWFEGFARGAKNTGKRAVARTQQMYDQYMLEHSVQRYQDRDESFGDILSDERPSFTTDSGETVQGSVGFFDFLGAASRYVDAQYANLIGTDDAENAKGYADALKEAMQGMAPKSEIAQEFEGEALKSGATAGETLKNIAVAAMDNPIGALSWALETAGESAPQLAAALGVTALTRNPAAGIAVLGGGSYATERYTSPAEFLQEKGIDTSTPEGLNRLLTDPKLLQEANERGVIRGTIVAAFDMLSGGLAGRTLAATPVVDVVAQSVQQAISGALGEYSARVAAGQPVDWADIFAEGLAEIATAPVDMGVAGHKLMRKRRAAKRAEEAPVTAEAIAQKATESKLRPRLDSKFSEWVNAAVSGSPVENVYVPAEAMQTYFQGAMVDPEAFIGELPGVSLDDFRLALATGGDLKIPTGTYAAKIAGSEFDPFLRENMRFDPEGMTFSEAQAFNEKAEDALQEAYEEAERLRLEEEQHSSFEAQIYDTMLSRLRAAGRSTDVARNEALIYPAFYRAMAGRSGNTVEDLMRMFPLPEVVGERPEGLQAKDVDEFTRTLAELRSRSQPKDERTSLLEFIADRGGINDPGGELASRDAEKVKRGNRTLKLKRGTAERVRGLFGVQGETGFGLDDVARAAIEAGYLQDDPVANAYRQAMEAGTEVPEIGTALLAAIDQELAGNAQFADEPTRAVERARELDQIEEYLNRIGVSLDDSDDAIREAVQKDQEGEDRKYGQEMRGSISFPEAGTPLISLFEKANLSTFLHESGHYFLAVTQALASQDGAPADVVEMYDTVKAWWRNNAADVARDAGNGVTADDVLASLDNGTTGDAAKDAAIDIGMQEQFARASEAYFMEGKAPNQGLRSAFEKFRAWLLNLYKRIAGLGVNVSDDLRRVFDRMLATDEEIENAQRSVDDEMAFQNAAEAGIPEDQFRALAKLHDQAQDEAKQKLLKEVMAPIQREREKWFKEEKAKVREEVERNINAQPVYRVWEWLGNRRWFGDGQPEDMPDMRMSKDILVDEYGEGVLKTLPRGRFTLYAVEDGLSPDEVAGWFGFASGDDMIRALEKAQPRKEVIEAETDRVMRERHGDVLKDGSVEEAALAAVHGDKRGQYLAAELKTLKALAGDTSADLTMQDAREIARRTLNRMSVRDAVNSRRYLAAERRAADDVIRLARISTRERINAQNARRDVGTAARKGIRSEDTSALGKTNRAIERANDPTERANERAAQMVDAARKRLINHALYAESVKIADEVGKAELFVAKLNKRSIRDKLAGDYLDAIDEILERYDFRKLSLSRERKRGALLAYIQRMTEDGRANELAIPDYVLADAKRTPYKQLQVEVLRGVIDTLKNIEHTARLKRKLIDAKRQRDLDTVVDGILDGFNGNIKGTPPTRAKSGRSPGRAAGRGYLNLVKTADTILREIDGFKDGGATYEGIKAPVDEAHADLAVKRREAAEKFEELYSVYSRDERRKMARLMDIPELGGQFSKWDLISIALNLGNDGNFQRLTDKRVKGHFAPEQVDAAMSRLDERDADFVQSVWDFINSYWPQIEARERRVTGVAPEKVPPRPVTIAGKQLKGGYYPLKYDAELSSLASDDESADLMKNMQGGRFGKAQTRSGHLKERGNSSGRPVLIDIGALHGHINQVIHDLALSEVVNNSWKILQDQRVKDAFINGGMQAEHQTLEVWLQDVATGEMRAGDVFNKLARRARKGFTVSKLALNLSTVLLQPTGNVQSMVVVGKKNWALGVSDMFRYDANPWKSVNAAAEEVMSVSPFMRERQSTFQKDIYDILGDTKTGPTQGRVQQIMNDVIAPLSFWMMQKAQFWFADMPTWFAGYRKAISQGMAEEKAIAEADRAVARAQGSGIFSDRSAVERGSLSRNVRQQDTVRLFTALGSYMFAKFNVAYERTKQTDFLDPRAVLIWATDMAMLFSVEAILYAAVHGDLPGMGDDDKEDGWAEFLAKQTALSVMQTLPVGRDIASGIQYFGGGGSTYGSVIETLVKPLEQARQGELDIAFVKSVIDAGGLMFMLPSTQIKRLVDATWGEDSEGQSPMEWVKKAALGG